MKLRSVKPQFVELIPDVLEPGVLYISMKYATASHLCLCGCGKEVATPLTPTDWRLTFDGRVSLHPSVGNWSFKCRSHYVIAANQVRWAGNMSQKEIDAGRERDRLAKQRQFGVPQGEVQRLLQGLPPLELQPQADRQPVYARFWDWIRSFWR